LLDALLAASTSRGFLEELYIDEVEIDDPPMNRPCGPQVKVLFRRGKDSWRQIAEDRIVWRLLSAPSMITAERDHKLATFASSSRQGAKRINDGNRKVIVLRRSRHGNVSLKTVGWAKTEPHLNRP